MQEPPRLLLTRSGDDPLRSRARGGRVERRAGGRGLTALAAITLVFCLLGLVGAVLLAARHEAAAIGLALMFGFGALRAAALLYEGSSPAWELSAPAIGEAAFLGLALAGLATLRALRRITFERDRAEDLHWDSMESVRVMSELAARPGADLSEKLRTVLELGAARFDLELGIAWCEGSGGDGEVLGLRTPAGNVQGSEMLAQLLPGLREVSQATRPQVISHADGAPPVLFGVGVFLDGQAHGALAFAGSRAREERFTTTDKDVLGLMAQWLSTELDRRERAAAPPPEPAPLPTLKPLRPGSGRDLNAAVQRVEHTLRRQVGVDATLDLSLDPALPPTRGGRLSLSTLVESVVHAAAQLAPTGRIRVETRQQSDTGQAEDLVLLVSVEGETIDAQAFERIFGEDAGQELPKAALPLARLERLLRRDGGDLSVAVEPRRGAVLSVYLPAQRTSAPERAAEAVQPS